VDSSRTIIREEGADSGGAAITCFAFTTQVGSDIDSKLTIVLASGRSLVSTIDIRPQSEIERKKINWK